MSVIEIINENGFIIDNKQPAVIHDEIVKLYREGKLQRFDELGIKYINESYFYTFTGNPFKLKVVEKTNNLFCIEKTINVRVAQ